MNNLHRELAPISTSAWEAIEEEATRSFKRNSAGRRIVDVKGPLGLERRRSPAGIDPRSTPPPTASSPFSAMCSRSSN